MMKMYNSVRHLIMELNELLIVYGYMIQNAPTEEARRLSELNRRTVKATKELFGNMFNDTFNKISPPCRRWRKKYRSSRNFGPPPNTPLLKKAKSSKC